MNTKNTSISADSGFTLIELLVTVSILGILAGLSLASFTLYKQNAEYSKGSATLHNARVAYNVGELDLPQSYALSFTESGTNGGDLSGELARVMPGTNVPDKVRLGVEVSVCDDSSDPMDRAAFLVAEPCYSNEELRWQKFCGGIEVLTEHVANPAPCS